MVKITGLWRSSVAALSLAFVLTACGGGNSGGDPLALSGTPSDSCSKAIKDGHDNEAAGRPAPFLPSVEVCGSLEAWIAAAKDFGINLNGREAQYVDNTCNAARAEVQGLVICQEAKAAANDPRRIP